MIDISTIFDRIEATFAVNAAIELFGAIIVVFAIVAVLILRADKGMLRHVVLAGTFTVMASVGDAIAAVFRGAPGQAARWAVILGNFFGVLGLLLCAVFYAAALFYTYRLVSPKIYRIFRNTIYVLGAIMLVVLVVSQFTGWLYTIDEHNLYKRGPLFFLSAAYTLSVIVLCVAYMIIRHRQAKHRVSFNAAFYIALPTLGMAVQFAFYGGVFLQISLYLLMLTILYHIQAIHTQRLVEQTETLSQRERELAQARDQMLLGQVRPHFIYNALAAIQHIEGNPPATQQAITDFANYLRGNLASLSSEELIPIDKELEHVRTYVDLEKLRFGDKIHVTFDLQDEAFALPPLSVQILVENAIKHGITARYEGGTVSVRTCREGDYHVVTVSDDGVGFDPARQEGHTHVGLSSVKNRIEYFVGGTLHIHSTIGTGTTATLRIPVAPHEVAALNRPKKETLHENFDS